MASKSTTERRGVPLRPDWASFAEREYVGQFVRSVAIIGRAAAGDGRPLTVPDKWRDGGTDLELILRAASSPLTSASVGAVLAQVSKQLLRSLIPYSAGAALLTSGIQVEWDGAGSISFPAIATAAGMAGF